MSANPQATSAVTPVETIRLGVQSWSRFFGQTNHRLRLDAFQSRVRPAVFHEIAGK